MKSQNTSAGHLFTTETIDIQHSWKFHHGDLPDAWKKDFDDSSWDEIRLPHDWSVTMPFSRDYSSGTGYAAGGIGWYRGRFSLPEEFRGRRILLTFDGIYKHAQIWCNSCYKEFHPNGYTPVSLDITHEAVFGDGVNEVSVRVDRTELADSRWFTGSGITRKAYLTVTGTTGIDEYGVFFSTPHADPESACIRLETTLFHPAGQEEEVTLTARLESAEGRCVMELSSCVSLSDAPRTSVNMEGTLEHPELWAPEHPYLYTLKLFLSSQKEGEVLCREMKAGIRTFSFDADHGFFLNGQSRKIKGVCVHHDAGALGAAVTKEIWARRLMKLKAMGCNAIRMSHNPHMPELYDLCDEMGFLVMDEAFDEWELPKNKWSTGHNVYPPKHQGYYQHFPQYHEEDLRTMILRDRNHPSVILWSIGNEIDYPNDPYCHPLFQTMTGNNDANKPEEERRYNPDRPNAERLAGLARMLAEEVRALDTTHPVTLAAAFPELSSHLGFLDALDVAGYNYKEHLYPESHERFPKLPFIGSENGHSLEAWRAVTDNDYISGQFLWTGIDYLGEAHGWPYRASGAGLLTLAGFEKTGYYRRMSFWSEIPMAHLASVRAEESVMASDREWRPYLEHWNYSDGEQTEVVCYTNLSRAELFLNGTSLGVRTKAPDEDGIRWLVPFCAGTLSVRASGSLTTVPSSEESFEATDQLVTSGAPCRLRTELFSVPEEFCSANARGGQILQAEVSVLDAQGRLCITDSSRITVQIDGGTFLGMENGDIADCTEYPSQMRRAFHGRLLIFFRKDGDAEVTVTARAEALAPSRLTV